MPLERRRLHLRGRLLQPQLRHEPPLRAPLRRLRDRVHLVEPVLRVPRLPRRLVHHRLQDLWPGLLLVERVLLGLRLPRGLLPERRVRDHRPELRLRRGLLTRKSRQKPHVPVEFYE